MSPLPACCPDAPADNIPDKVIFPFGPTADTFQKEELCKNVRPRLRI